MWHTINRFHHIRNVHLSMLSILQALVTTDGVRQVALVCDWSLDWWDWGIQLIIDFCRNLSVHDDVIKWKHFLRYWPFVGGIHRWPVNSPHKGQWRGAWMFSLICAWINGWLNNREAGDLRRHRARYDVNVMNVFVHTHLSFSSRFTYWFELSA